jgi:hypothetical protein
MFQRVRVAVGAVAALLATTVAFAQPVASLNDVLLTSCSKEELGRVTAVKLLDHKQANAMFKAAHMPATAKSGDVFVQVTASSKASKRDLTIHQLKAAPSQAELTGLVGKPQCAFEAED